MTGIDFHTTGFGWTSVDLKDSISDHLKLQDSANAGLDTISMTAGKISQLRFIPGVQNSVSINGSVFQPQLSSQNEPGLKLHVHQNIEPNSA